MKRCGWHRNRCSGSSCRAAWLNPASAGFTRRAAGPTIPPEQLLLALLLQAIYSIRSGRMLVEQLDCWRRAGLLSSDPREFKPGERGGDYAFTGNTSDGRCAHFVRHQDRLASPHPRSPAFAIV